MIATSATLRHIQTFMRAGKVSYPGQYMPSIGPDVVGQPCRHLNDIVCSISEEDNAHASPCSSEDIQRKDSSAIRLVGEL